MGGSVAFREGCKSGVRFHDLQTCFSWPYRSNVLLKELFGDVVLVTNLAVGGTNTAVGTTISKYDTLAGDTDQADIIITINAYVANDNLEQKEQDIFQIVPFSYYQGVENPFSTKKSRGLATVFVVVVVIFSTRDGAIFLLFSFFMPNTNDTIKRYWYKSDDLKWTAEETTASDRNNARQQ